MFELCINRPHALARHRAAPLVKARERFIEHLHGTGMARMNLRSVAASMLQIVTILKMRGSRKVSLEEIEQAAKRWIDSRTRYSGHPPGHTSIGYFRWIARTWLRSEGRLLTPPRFPQAFSKELDDYVARMKSELGLAEVTIYERRLRAAKFLNWFSRKHRNLQKMSLEHVDAYLVESARNWKLITLSGECCFLKAFLYHAVHRGWCSEAIPHGIKAPPVRQDIFEPQGPRWPDVLKLIRSVRGREPASIRAKALFLLFGTYGLRSSEALRLRVEDFDWKRNSFTVKRAKRGGFQEFPVSRELAEAIHQYLESVRPACECPQLFLTLRKPYRPMRTHTMPNLFRRRMRACGIDSKHHGPQALRHSCATHLLNRGAHLQDIADFLGHRSCEAVRTYAKFSLQSLKEVVKVDLTRGL